MLPRLWVLAFVTIASVTLSAQAGQAPFVGDEGLEPRERRIEASLGTNSVGAALRLGYPRRTGVSGVASVRTQWQGGWTTVGVGGCYRVFGGYPFRMVLRADVEAGFGPIHGPSVALRAIPGVAAEVGREGRVAGALGVSLPVSLFVLPDRALTRDLSYDAVLSAPIRDRWRAGLGFTITQVDQVDDSPWSTYQVNVMAGLARWL